MTDQWLKYGISFLPTLLEALAAVIILIGALNASVKAFWIKDSSRDNAIKEARLRLGRWLALGLEFLLAADVLRTAVAPTWNEIGQLAAISTIRTALNYFLEREIKNTDNESSSQDSKKATAPAGNFSWPKFTGKKS